MCKPHAHALSIFLFPASEQTQEKEKSLRLGSYLP